MRLGVEASSASRPRRARPGRRRGRRRRDHRLRARERRTGAGSPSPGFVDLQVNGFAGVDFLDADADGYRRAGEALLETGVTAYLPTFITAPEEHLVAALRGLPVDSGGPQDPRRPPRGPVPRRGAARDPSTPRPAAIPDPALLERLLAAGPVRLMTLAPELDGAGELIDLLLARGVTVSCGHSDATAEQAMAAFDRGARTVTHLFNAMRPLRPPRSRHRRGGALARATSSSRSSSTACTSPTRRPASCGGRPRGVSRS